MASSEARDKPSSRVMKVNAAKATAWLENNVHNRDLRESHVGFIAAQIHRHEWRLTPDAIGFDTQGRLTNGQHRLLAIQVADPPGGVDVLVVWGLTPESQDITDQGLKRQISDSLKLKGEANTTDLAAALQWLHRLDYIEQTGLISYQYRSHAPSAFQALARLDATPEIRDHLKVVRRLYDSRELPLRKGAIAALVWRMTNIDPQETEVFLQSLASGLDYAKTAALAGDEMPPGLAHTNPIYHLRRAISQDRPARRGGRGRMEDWRQVALFTKAWNEWRDQKPINQLVYKHSATAKEQFPLPR